MSDEKSELTIKVESDENGLVACGCGENDLYWRGPRDRHAREADHSLAEAREIGGSFPWERKDPEDESMQRLFDDDAHDIDSWDDYVAREKGRAERNGVKATCGECYGSMSLTVATDELRDRAGGR
jgi:hypothetical protein